MNLTLMLCLGMAWAGVILLFLAIFAGIQRIVTPQPKSIPPSGEYPPMTQQVRDILDGKYNTKKAPEARSRGTRDWDEIERDINK